MIIECCEKDCEFTSESINEYEKIGDIMLRHRKKKGDHHNNFVIRGEP